jgi:hypothetical protein
MAWQHTDGIQSGFTVSVNPSNRRRISHGARALSARMSPSDGQHVRFARVALGILGVLRLEDAVNHEHHAPAAIVCTLRFGRSFLPVLGFEVRARSAWLGVAASKRRRSVTLGSPRNDLLRETHESRSAVDGRRSSSPCNPGR